MRFGPTAYDDPMEALTRLKQTTSIAVYKAQFEALSNRLKGLSDHHKLSFFLSGLKDEIRLPIRNMFLPISLSVAYGLAKIQEEYLLSTRRALKLAGEMCREIWGDHIVRIKGDTMGKRVVGGRNPTHQQGEYP